MKLRRCFAPRQLLFLFAAGLLTLGARLAAGQETITIGNGQPQEATILGVTDTGIKVQVGDATMVQPFANVTAVTMNPPPEFTAAQAAYETGDLSRALALTNSVVATYRGLPTDWARQAMLMLGDIYMGMKQLPQAEAVYKNFRQIYPGAGSDEASVGLASLDLANSDFAAATAKIQPVLGDALKTRNPPKARAALIGRAFYISGKIKEQSGDFSGALEDYLRTVTLFPEDPVAGAGAQAAADALRRDHGAVTP